MIDKQFVSTLNELIETSKDGEKGFALALKDSRETELAPLFAQGLESCRAAAGELQYEVSLLGGAPEDGGSVMASAHRGWICLRSAMASRDSRAILEECERGEDCARARYAEALKLDLPAPVRSILERQYHEVVAHHDRVRDLRNRYCGGDAPHEIRSSA